MKRKISLLLLPLLLGSCQQVTKSMTDSDLYMRPASKQKGIPPKDEAVESLVLAAFEGNLPALQAAIAAGADINALAQNGRTALMAASDAGHANCVQALLQAGAKTDIMAVSYSFGPFPPGMCVTPNFKALERRTALGYAAYKGHGDCVTLLVEAGANVNIVSRNISLQTPLMNCAEHGDLASVKLLLSHGAKIDTRDEKDKTALMYACGSKKGYACAKSLIKAGAKVNHSCRYSNETPLSYACAFGTTATMELLLQKGADIAEDVTWDKSLLARVCTRCCADDNVEGCKLLLKHGANPKMRNPRGRTALHYVCWFENEKEAVEMIQLLHKAGADINAKDKDGDTPFRYAMANTDKNARLAIIKTLISLGAERVNPQEQP